MKNGRNIWYNRPPTLTAPSADVKRRFDGDRNQTKKDPCRQNPSVTSAAEPVKVMPPSAVAISLEYLHFSQAQETKYLCIIFF